MVALAAVLLSALSGCGNPSYDVQIEGLPPDTGAVKPGGSHRAGQPCILCHGPYKGAYPQFSLAGTVFTAPTTADQYVDAVADVESKAAPGVTVTVYDTNVSSGRQIKSDASGNFMIKIEDNYTPLFPLGARMDCPQNGLQFTMISRISREGSCNGCHNLRKDQASPGWLECDALQ